MHDKIAVLLSVVLAVIVAVVAVGLVAAARTSDDPSLRETPFDPVAALTEIADPTYQAISASEFAIGLAAWTRVLNLRYQNYNKDAVIDFISTHSCRFDSEGFC